MNEKTNKTLIFLVVVGLLTFLTHCKELNEIPEVEVSGGGVYIDIGDFHYCS